MSESVTSLRLKVDSTDVKNADKDLNNLSKTAGNIEKSIGSMSKALIGSVAAFTAITAGASSFISTAGKFEQFSTSLKVLSGSAAAAEKNFAWVKDFTAKTPYTLDETMQAFIRLKAYGIDATSGSLKVLGDTASAMGKPLMAAVEAMADAMVGENERLKEFGIRASKSGDTISYSWMDSSGKAKEKIIQNNGEIIKSTLEAIFNEKYKGMMEEQSKTWVGAVSNLEDTWTSFKDTLARDSGAFEIAKDSVKGLNEILLGTNDEFNNFIRTATYAGEVIGGVAVAYGTYIAVQKASLGYLALSTSSTIAYNIATNVSTTTVTRLTVAQVAATVATKAWTAALNLNPLVLGATAIAAGIYGVVQAMDAFSDAQDRNAKNSKSYADKQDKYFKSFRYTIDEIKKPLSELEKQEKGYLLGIDAARKSGNKSAEKVYQDNVNRIQKEKKVYLDAIKEQENAANKKAGIKKVGKTQAEIIADLEKDAPAAKVKKEKKAGKTEAEKLEEDIAKAKKDAMEDTADREAKIALDLYKSKEDAIQDSYDREAQLTIDLYQTELDAIENNANRKSELALAFYEMTRSEQDKINEANLALYEANVGLFNDEQMQTFFSKWQESIEGVKGGYNDIQGIVSSFVEDSLNSKDWTVGLTGTAKSVANLGNAFKDIQKQTAKYDKAVKKVNESQLTDEEKKIEFKKIEEAQLGAQIGAYANLAGAAAGFFEEGSKGAQAMQAVSATLGIAQGIQAVISAWGSAPFPANMPAVAATTAAVLPMIGQLTSLGGKGGGSISPPPMMTVGDVGGGSSAFQGADKTQTLESAINQLERTITISNKIAERTGLYGSAFVNELRVSEGKLIQEFTDSWRESFSNMTMADIEGTLIGFDISKLTTFENGVTTQYQTVLELLNGLSDFSTTFSTALANAGGNMPSIIQFQEASKEAIDNFSSGLLDLSQELSDHRDDWIKIFEDITDTDKYTALELSKATTKISELTKMLGANDLPDVLDKLINVYDIDYKSLQKYLADGDMLGLAQKLKDIFPTDLYSPENIYDYVQAIESVGSAMVESTNNIKDFMDSLLTSDQMAQQLAGTLGITLATNVDELASLFNQLSNDMDGLTSSDIDLLNANKELLLNTDKYQSQIESLNTTIDNTSQNISALDGALSTISATIDKLKSASRTSEQNLQIFYDAMAEAQRLSGTDDYAAYAEAVKKAADTSSALFNKDNFALTRDMEYAQLVAANQFEDLQDNTLTQVDILKQIEENTRLQVTAITEAMNNFGMSINAQLLQALKQKEPKKLLEQWDKGQWESTGGAIATGSGANYSITSTSGDTISSAEAIGFVNSQLQAGDAMAVYNAALATGISANSLDAMMGWASGTSNEWASLQNLPSFAIGTANVTNDMLANIHKGEIITPAPFADGLRNGSLMMGNQNSLVNELQKNNSLLSGIITKQDQQIQVLLESRDIQNGSLIELENIGVII